MPASLARTLLTRATRPASIPSIPTASRSQLAVIFPRPIPTTTTAFPNSPLIRYKSSSSSPADTVKLNFQAPRDERIPFPTADYVDPYGEYHPEQSIHSILSELDREIYQLCIVNVNPPTVRALTKVQIRESEENSQQLAKERKKKQKAPKEVQISWAIDPHDLGVKLRKVQQFLEKGNRVDIIVAGKKGMRKMPLSEMKEMLEGLKGKLAEFGREWREAEGEVGTTMTMFYEKPKRDSGGGGEKRNEEGELEGSEEELKLDDVFPHPAHPMHEGPEIDIRKG